MTEHKGKLTISRVRSNVSDGYVSITIEDSVSGCTACTVECSVLEFAEALMAHGYRDCSFSLNLSGVIGKKRELREIIIPRPEKYSSGEQQDKHGLAWITKKAAKELIDGWQPHHPSEVFNSHRFTDGKQVRVTLIRFVDAENPR